MKQYRKLPVVVEAVQWDGSDQVRDALEARGARFNFDHGSHVWHDLHGGGWLAFQLGDWIVRGAAGEFYPVTEAVFAATHSPVE